MHFRATYDVDDYRVRANRTLAWQAQKTGVLKSFEDHMVELLDPGDAIGWRYEMPSMLVAMSGDVSMAVFASGPTNSGLVLLRAVLELADPEGAYEQPIDHQMYGVHLRFTRHGDVVTLDRIGESAWVQDPVEAGRTVRERDHPELNRQADGDTLKPHGPPFLNTTYGELRAGAQRYRSWLMNEHPVDAPWLLRVGEFARWRREAGLED